MIEEKEKTFAEHCMVKLLTKYPNGENNMGEISAYDVRRIKKVLEDPSSKPTRVEDYNVISPDNKIWDYLKWINNPNVNKHNISENPYPVMYVENEPVWEGDTLLFNGIDDEGNPMQFTRKVYFNHRGIISSNPQWIDFWSWSINK